MNFSRVGRKIVGDGHVVDKEMTNRPKCMKGFCIAVDLQVVVSHGETVLTD